MGSCSKRGIKRPEAEKKAEPFGSAEGEWGNCPENTGGVKKKKKCGGKSGRSLVSLRNNEVRRTKD